MAGTSPRVTVVIPTRNRAHFLPRAVDSVLAQTYPDFALLVVDNGSRDETPAVIAGYADERLQAIRHEDDLGITENHNRALAAVETEYALVVPDDDMLRPEILEVTVPFLDEHPRAGMVHARFDVIDADGRVLAEDQDWTYGLRRDTIESGPDFIREAMLWSCRVCASTALMRVEALPSPVFDSRDFPSIDFGLWLRMAQRWEMAFLARPLASYRIHGETHSAAFGPPHGPGYIQRPEIVQRLRDVKVRFLSANGNGSNAELRRHADEAMRRELIWLVRNETLPDRRRLPTLRGVVGVTRVEPRVLRDPALWRLVGGSLIGPRLIERLKRLRPSEQPS